jgi:hypothetical protein
MSERKTLAEIRAELAADAEACEACAEYGECLDHDTDWLDDQADRIYREQGSGSR